MAPRPSLEWHLTDLCNYRCPYCCEGQHLRGKRRHGHAKDATIQAVSRLLENLPGSWQVKFSGAEETIHPAFMEVCRRVIACGHTIALTTNFSPARPRLEEFVKGCGPALEFFNASLHLGQVDPDKFIDKAVFFQGIKDPATDFTVCAVVTEDNFDELMAVRDRLGRGSVAMAFQVLKVGAEFYRYPEHIEKEIADSLVGGTDSIRSFKSYGTPCHTGQFFFVVKPNGRIFRCFSKTPWYNYMGNIRQGSFSLYDGPRPCLADECTCVVPANRNMIRFGESAGTLAIARHKAECLLTRLPNLLREPLYRGVS
jgi:hypothetical protein